VRVVRTAPSAYAQETYEKPPQVILDVLNAPVPPQIRGHGGTTRLVMLPHEAHGYAARESIQHVPDEMLSWFERYLKDVR
jgi:hypothetical protein